MSERIRSSLMIALSVVVGCTAWSGHVLALPIALAFPVLWAHARSRLIAAMASAGYFLAAARGLPQGVANFYAADLIPGFLLWVAASLSFVLVHAALWTKRPGKGRALRYLAALMLMALPPFGITGWAHPATAAGVVFPGWGWSGLIAAAAGLLAMTTKWWPAAATVLGGLWLWSAASWTPPSLPDGWIGVDLKLGQSLGRDASLNMYDELLGAVLRSATRGVHTVVLPESALGAWTPSIERVWRDHLTDSGLTVVAGATIVREAGYDNVLLNITENGGGILYRQRMPVPVSMWQPWASLRGESVGVEAKPFGGPVVEVQNGKVSPLICYEQLIVWPILHSMIHSPDTIVAVGNGWWTSGTSIVAIQQTSVAAWAKLFDLPLVTAFNR